MLPGKALVFDLVSVSFRYTFCASASVLFLQCHTYISYSLWHSSIFPTLIFRG